MRGGGGSGLQRRWTRGKGGTLEGDVVMRFG